ncbi:hypothetical protein BC830DRAFT_498105 [Chytriomyces sp. MP71]|nr:hypothetical protein BC830DRAFT_498105 [Chytriomyces sp. MP71]
MAATATKHQSYSQPQGPSGDATTHNDKTRAEKPVPQSVNHKIETEEILGPLPKDWEKAHDETNRPYFVNHKKKSTSWIDPRTFHLRKHNIKDIVPGELPYGWEEVYESEANDYYFVDHQTETHYWIPPWEKETRDKVIQVQKAAHEKAKAEKAAAKKAQKDAEALKEVDKHIAELESQRKALNEVLGADSKPAQRKSTISKAEIEKTVKELREKNAKLEADHLKLLSEQQVTLSA